MSEYNIPVLVKWFAKRPSGWNPEGKMDQYMGTVIMCREVHDQYQSQRHGSDIDGHDPFWYWSSYHVIPNPTPSQIEEEARKAGKATVTTKPLVDPMTVNWPRSEFAAGMEVMIKQSDKEHAERRGIDWTKPQVIARDDGSPGNQGPFWIKGQEQGCFDPKHLVPLSKIREYEAAQSAQKGPMPIETQVTKQIKETIAAKALREAMDKVKADQERVDGLKAIVALEDDKRKAKEHLKGIDDQIATLSKKWLKWVGK